MGRLDGRADEHHRERMFECTECTDQVLTSKGAATPGQNVFPVVASSEIAVGVNRLQIVLIDKKMLRSGHRRRSCKSASSAPVIRSPSLRPRSRLCGRSNQCRACGWGRPASTSRVSGKQRSMSADGGVEVAQYEAE